jgi:hypothetical protein
LSETRHPELADDFYGFKRKVPGKQRAGAVLSRTFGAGLGAGNRSGGYRKAGLDLRSPVDFRLKRIGGRDHDV